MTEDDLERTLRGAFDAHAHASVSDQASPPPPRFATMPDVSVNSRSRLVRWAAPLTAAAAVVAVVGAAAAISRSTASHDADQNRVLSQSNQSNQSTPSASADPTAVHVKLHNDDNANYGVGMPVIAYFSKRILNGKSLQQATTATVNGKPIEGAWYFETSKAGNGPIEAHFRPADYWPGHAAVHVSIPVKGLSAGGGLTYDNNLTTDFHTGAANIAKVDNLTHKMVVTTDGKPYGSFPVSLGIRFTPTRPGIKVIMEKSNDITLHASSSPQLHVQYAQRLTYGGEYLSAAEWNVANIKKGVNTSGGGTNLLPADAKKLFNLLQIGDPVEYVNTGGTPMQLASGYGDWNVPWKVWLTGGLVPTH
ncbi:MAG: hypothetical protein QOF92_1299 [Pseudonocardiales bacterium]|jgi:lipoprotein-anchoring transpeptidase ErfK/SrfK|nr:hypothetical protein [Pseudonocardiales bacterium]